MFSSSLGLCLLFIVSLSTFMGKFIVNVLVVDVTFISISFACFFCILAYDYHYPIRLRMDVIMKIVRKMRPFIVSLATVSFGSELGCRNSDS